MLEFHADIAHSNVRPSTQGDSVKTHDPVCCQPTRLSIVPSCHQEPPCGGPITAPKIDLHPLAHSADEQKF